LLERFATVNDAVSNHVDADSVVLLQHGGNGGGVIGSITTGLPNPVDCTVA
jgi:hypothetical protein